MPNILVHSPNDSVSISGQALQRLLDHGNGDAALLYLALLRKHGALPPQALAGELRWDRLRLEAAENALRELGLITPADLPEPADEKPAYQNADVSEKLSKDREFAGLTAEVERRLGKKLTTPDVAILLGLYDFLGLPADVIYLLVCHCAERVARRYGEGRRPTLRQIEKEGYVWARLEIFTLEQAETYLTRRQEKKDGVAALKRALGIRDRELSATERNYLEQWLDLGFPQDSILIAYDRTVTQTGGLKWAYMNKILQSWHQKGLRTPEQIETGDTLPGRKRPPQQAPAQTASRPGGEKERLMKIYESIKK